MRFRHFFILSILSGVILALLGTATWASAEDTVPADVAAGEAPSSPDSLGGTIDIRRQGNEEGAQSQKRVEQLSDEADDLFTQYRGVLRQIQSLRTYNLQMDELIASQRVEMSDQAKQLDQIDLVSRDITPLMLRMIEALDQFVRLDVPFLTEERTQRMTDLRTMMKRADVTEASKYRSIMEAYQIESEFGRTIEAYRSTLARGNQQLTVDFLRLGRIVLVYQTLDESEAGVWNQDNRTWDPLDGSYRSAIREGLRIARKQTAPDMIRVPVFRAIELKERS